MELTFEDPPEPKPSKQSEWDEIRQKLIANTGQWARTASYPNRGTAYQIVNRIKNSLGGWRGHRWDAQYRHVDDSYLLYIRHLATDDGESA